MFRVGEFDQAAVDHICLNLRLADYREMACVIEDFTPEKLSARCSLLRKHVVVAWADELPVAVMGGVPVHPTLYNGYMFATDRFPVIGLPMTRWCRHGFFPGLRRLGARRVEAHSIEGHTSAHRWIEAIGAKKESVVPQFGMNGETFIRFAYLWDEGKAECA